MKDQKNASFSRSQNEPNQLNCQCSNNKLFENLDFCKYDHTPSLDSVRWLTTNEAAHYLRVSVSSLKMMIYRGQVKVQKLGRRNRFLRDELERLISPSEKRKVI